jgi:hypothetical protein
LRQPFPVVYFFAPFSLVKPKNQLPLERRRTPQAILHAGSTVISFADSGIGWDRRFSNERNVRWDASLFAQDIARDAVTVSVRLDVNIGAFAEFAGDRIQGTIRKFSRNETASPALEEHDQLSAKQLVLGGGTRPIRVEPDQQSVEYVLIELDHSHSPCRTNPAQ